jgi:hypothetical protein
MAVFIKKIESKILETIDSELDYRESLSGDVGYGRYFKIMSFEKNGIELKNAISFYDYKLVNKNNGIKYIEYKIDY